MPQILAFGDSITYGAWDEEGGWVQRLRKHMDKKGLKDPDYFDVVYNLGVPGDTSSKLAKRFLREMRERLDKGEPTVFIFAIGINDSEYLQEEKHHIVSQKEFRNNLNKLVREIGQLDAKTVFLGLTPVDEKKLDSVPWLSYHVYKNEYIQKYDGIIQSFCTGNNFMFVDLFRLFLSQPGYKKLLHDGLHPNDEGHKLIFEAVRDCLVKKEWI